MKKFLAGGALVLATLFFFLQSGCSSAYVVTTITNQSKTAVSLIEVDYPSASFGMGTLAAGAEYHYRFKVQGSGPLKIQFNDVTGKTHTISGPELSEGDQGTLHIYIDTDNRVNWLPQLSKKN